MFKSILFFLFISSVYFSFSTTPFEFMLKEKMKYSPEEAMEMYHNYQKNKDQNQSNDIILSDLGSNVQISNSNMPESEIHAAVNPLDTNNMIASPILQNSADPFQAITCPVYFTKDGGETWQKSDFISIPPDLGHPAENLITSGGGDPMFSFDANGRAYMSWINLIFTLANIGTDENPQMTPDSAIVGIFWAYSDDGGETWESSQSQYIEKITRTPLSDFMMGNSGAFLDKQWMASDLSDSPFRNSVYMSLCRIGASSNNPEGESRIAVYRKRPGEANFNEEPVYITDPDVSAQFANIAVDNEGKVHVSMFIDNGIQGGVYHSVSDDGGLTFREPKLVSELTGSNPFRGVKEGVIGISDDRMYPAIHLAVDNSKESTEGNLYITWSANGIDQGGLNGLDVYFAKSTNGGSSWSDPIIVNNDPKEGGKVDNYYPNITVNNRGHVVVGWYDRRNQTDGVSTHYYLAYSFDGGETFSTNFPITDETSDFSRIGRANQDFGIGEYNGLVTTGYNAFPFWADGRLNNGDINVYTAKVGITDNPVSVNLEDVKILDTEIENLTVIPNPVSNNATLSFNHTISEQVRIEIYDISGNRIFSTNQFSVNGNNIIDLNLENLSSGNYFVKVFSENGMAVERLVKE